MDLQSLYGGIVDFWNTISPVLFAHLFFLIALIWVRKKPLNFGQQVEKIINSESYKRWKKFLDEFELMPKIPFVVLILLFFYLAMFNGLIGFINSPLSIYYSESDFWREANENYITSEILQVSSYENKLDAHIWDIADFKETQQDVYKSQYADRYGSFVTWIDKLVGKWTNYYQLSFFLLAIFLVILAVSILRKVKHISWKRLTVVLLVLMVSVAYTRYKTEQYIEQRLSAELDFVVHSLQTDKTTQSKQLNQEQIDSIACNIKMDRDEFSRDMASNSAHIDFWFSRLIQNYAPRVFKTNSLDAWRPPTQCK